MKKYLVISEVSKKQGYIFKTNKLKENIGASTIIEYITEELPREVLKEILGVNDSDLEREYVVNAGGGNSLFMLDSVEDAVKFIKLSTKKVIKDFPGVEFFMTYHEFDYDNDSIMDAIDDIYKELNKKKSARKSVFARKSYGIEEECVSTHMVAYEKSKEGFLSRESSKKRAVADGSSKSFTYNKGSINNILDDYQNEKYKFTKDIDDLITEKGDNSYVAIVTLDGNKMGQKIQHMKENAKKFLSKGSKAKNNDHYRGQLQEFSYNIKQYYENSFRAMLDAIDDNYEYIEKALKLKEINAKIAIDSKGKYTKLMPVRPIILAGDDVCFVCNAKIALECVRVFIEHLNKYTVEGEQLNACAGICMLKSAYPFDKGYEIAENLCKNGKAKIVDSNDASLVDFHICQGEISTSLNEIRKSVFVNQKEIELNVKPLYINITPVEANQKFDRIITERKTYNTYKNFKGGIDIIEKAIKNSGKGKIRKLRDVFPQGKQATELFMNKYRIKLEDGFECEGIKETKFGFREIDKKDTCLFFDIIELQDMFINFDK